MRLELIEGKLSRSVPRGLGGSNPTWLLGAGGKGQKDLARMPTLLLRRSGFQARLSRSVRLQDKGSVLGAYVPPRFFSAPSPCISESVWKQSPYKRRP